MDDNSGIFTQEDLGSVTGEQNDSNTLSSSDKKSMDGSKKNNEIDKNDANIDGGNNENDDDDESSIDSFSSSQTGSTLPSIGSSSSEASLTLMERQARNIARNERFLGSLREKYKEQLGESEPAVTKGVQGTSKTTEKCDSVSNGDNIEGGYSRTDENLGMIRKDTHRLFKFSPTTEIVNVKENNDTTGAKSDDDSYVPAYHGYASGIAALEEKYPHRTVSIGKLHSILSSTISLTASVSANVVPSSAASVYVPPPIFCMGSKGTGKTSVVCDVVGLLSSQTSSSTPSTLPTAKVQPAYVDCSIVEPSTVDRLVYTIYKQLKPSLSASIVTENKSFASNTKIRGKKRKRKVANFNIPPKAPPQDDTNTKDEHDHESKSKSNRGKQHPKDNELESNQNRVLPSRKAKKAAIHKSIAYNAKSYKSVHRERARGNKEDIYQDEDEEYNSDEEAVATLHSAVLSLGRSLQKYYGALVDDNGTYRNRNFCRKPKCGILVLDRAEELLSLSSSSKKGTSASPANSGANNYLSELLLLPKIMKLNITIVVVTNYCTLQMTRKSIKFFFSTCNLLSLSLTIFFNLRFE